MNFIHDTNFWRRFHLVSTVLWVLLIIPSVTIWNQSIQWVIFMSVWANVSGSVGAWQASRAETKIDAQDDLVAGGGD